MSLGLERLQGEYSQLRL